MYSCLLLTAACVTGAAAVQGPPGCNCAAVAPQTNNVTYYPATPVGGLGYRLRTFFQGARPQYSPYHPVTAPQAIAPSATGFQTAPPPEATSEEPSETHAVNIQKLDLKLPKKHEDKVGHETDYSWITGHLFYVRADGGRWVLRYGQADEVDKFGGSVVLAPVVEMRNYREGDLVCVTGEVLDEGRASRSLGGPLYRVNTISMVERADP